MIEHSRKTEVVEWLSIGFDITYWSAQKRKKGKKHYQTELYDKETRT